MLQHILYKYAVPFCGVIDKHMGHCPNQLAILQDRSTAHSLNDAASYFDQFLIGNLQNKLSVQMLFIVYDICDLDIIEL